MNKLKIFAPIVLRLGMVFVFVWFGLNQLLNQSMWVSLIPVWIVNATGISAGAFVVINGLFEIIMAMMLSFGFHIRLVATLLFLHLAMIVSDVGLSAVGVRDVGLMFGLLSVAFQGADIYSYDEVEIVSEMSPQ